MTQTHILFPVIALAALTFAVGIRMGILRVRAVRAGELRVNYFKYNSGAEAPDYLKNVSNNYQNLLEIPILFYLVSVLIFVTNNVDMIYVALAWAFVVTRYIHSYIHITSNKVLSRRKPFILGLLILMIIWIRFTIDLI